MRTGTDPRASDGELTFGDLLRPLRRRWKLVAASVAVCLLGGLAATLLPAREYRPSMVLAAVPNARGNMALGGSLSSLLGSGQLGGVQSTPLFISKLLYMRRVLHDVAFTKVGSPPRPIVELLAERPAGELTEFQIDATMREVLSTEVDKQTGLISVSVTHADSALARHTLGLLIAGASKTFVEAVRAQASEQRRAQQLRVDSAAAQLRRREEQLQGFMSANRVYTPYSSAALQRQRIERDLENARAVYSQAVTDRETAIARELEETPAVVIVDPVQASLDPLPRRGLLKLIGATALGLLVGLLLVVVAESSWRGRE